MHGEHASGDVMFDPADGPSPHARGTLPGMTAGEARARTIPACTGNTHVACHSLPSTPDHPRMHGEHASRTSARMRAVGPSPHARGTPRTRARWRPTPRTIPACTGNTAAASCLARINADHPRMHGEHLHRSHVQRGENGPSPHARGTPGDGQRWRSRGRTIPACTGNTLAQRQSGRVLSDHPRMHGEHRVLSSGDQRGIGPSPHARGTQLPPESARRRGRTIPACTGNTARGGRP